MEKISSADARRTFQYGWSSYAMLGLLALGWLWLVRYFFRSDGWSGWVIFLAALFPALLWDSFGHPSSFVVENGRLTARWFWGRQRSWSVAELTIPGAASMWSLASSGYSIVFQRRGGWAFIVRPQLEDFEDFVEIIEPGSRKAREPKYNPNSWWNRNLLK